MLNRGRVSKTLEAKLQKNSFNESSNFQNLITTFFKNSASFRIGTFRPPKFPKILPLYKTRRLLRAWRPQMVCFLLVPHEDIQPQICEAPLQVALMQTICIVRTWLLLVSTPRSSVAHLVSELHLLGGFTGAPKTVNFYLKMIWSVASRLVA
jgi:hypothetical protein